MKLWHFEWCDMIISMMRYFIFLPPFRRYIYLIKKYVSNFHFLYITDKNVIVGFNFMYKYLFAH